MKLQKHFLKGSPWVGYVYFVGSPAMKAIKIGVTQRHPRWRLETFRTSSAAEVFPIGVLPGGPCEETWIHSIFDRHRMHHEWFRCEGEFRRFLEECVSPWPPNSDPEPVDVDQRDWRKHMERCLEGVFEWLMVNNVPFPQHPAYEPRKYDMSKHPAMVRRLRLA